MKIPSQRWMECSTIIAVVVLALAILFPAASTARSGGKSALCLANLHTMTRAWLLYAEDNGSNIVGSGTAQWDAWQMQRRPAWDPSAARKPIKNFVAFPQDENHNFRNQSVQDEVRGLQQGGLWPYINNAATYHCPTDLRFVKPPANFPNEKGGYRSYSMGNVYNGYGINDGWTTGESYAIVTKTGEIRGPSTKLVFLEETDGQGYNVNVWDIFLNTAANWPGDPLAGLHGARSIFSFADGHVEFHAWMDPTTIRVFKDQAHYRSYGYEFGPTEGSDLTWFVSHYIPGEIRPELQAMLPAYK